MDLPWWGSGEPARLSASDFERAAARMGCDVAAIEAVWEVEAGSRHFLDDGSLIRRFEPHHFPQALWSQIGFSVRKSERPWRASLRLSTDAMLHRAARLDMRGACRASSWGAPQIMGFNHRDAGYPDPVAMVQAMADSAEAQLGAFVTLIEAWGLDSALRGHDWRAFARRYNGSGQVERYAAKMEAAFRRHSGGAASAVILKVGSRGRSVVELQRALGIADDGAFGPATLAAVRAFQEEAGLAVDGIVGWRTWDALKARAEAAEADAQRASAAGVQVEPAGRPLEPHPEAQQTEGEAALETASRWSSAVGAVTAAAGGATAVMGEMREVLGETGLTIVIVAGIAAILVSFTLGRRARRQL